MLECVCVITEGRTPPGPAKAQKEPAKHPKYCEDPQARQKLPGLKDIDLCEIVKRSQDEKSKHNDYECHLKGERRQNLINKIKMYLDDYDDRPVMKGKGKAGDEGKALGQTGFGPMIKYPGYVDYDHPYFSDPYNKMPTLATTVGQRGENPCTPIQVRNWDECHPQLQGRPEATTSAHGGQVGSVESQDGTCHCAGRSGEVSRCHAARSSPEPRAPDVPQGVYQSPPRGLAVTPQSPPSGSCRYICIPLPSDC